MPITNYLKQSLFFGVLLPLQLIAQLGSSNATGFDPKTILPPSPEASGLVRFIDVPVGHYTGLPEINIPLYTITQGPLSVPMSMQYHAASNKVESTAQYTGLGWTLRAGGTVTRVIRGLPDDLSKDDPGYAIGFLSFIREPGRNLSSVLSDWVQLDRVAERCADSEPDLYYFNVNGLHGTFTFDWDGNLVVDCDRKVELIPKYENNDPSKTILGWTLIDDFGTKYELDEPEMTEAVDQGLSCNLSDQYASAWHLTSMADHNLRHSITLTYQNNLILTSFFGNSSYTHLMPGQNSSCAGSPSGRFSSRKVSMKYHGKVLESITTSDGRYISFENNFAREDLEEPLQPEAYALSRIQIFNISGENKKSFKFQYDYSTGRLSLKSIQECANNGISCKPDYQLTYHNRVLPERNSFAQDHWGFYNGQTGNQHLVPGQYLINTYFEGANRQPDHEYGKAGLLTGILHPSGAKTVFEYEGHTYSKSQYEENAGGSIRYKTRVSSEGTNSHGTCPHADFDCEESEWSERRFCIISNKPEELVTVYASTAIHTVREEYFGFGRGPKVEIINEAGERVYGFNEYNESDYQVLSLPPGDYIVRSYSHWKNVSNSDLDLAQISVSYTQETMIPENWQLIGGSRVARILQFSGENENEVPVVKRFIYENTEGQSSGVIYKLPTYSYSDYNYQTVSSSSGNTTDITCDYTYRVSSNVSQLGTTSGSHIGYSHVEEWNGEYGEYGRTDYEFTTPFEYGDVIYTNPPFPPNESQSYKTGHLIKKTEYTNNGGIFSPIVEESIDYGFKDEVIPALKVSFRGGTTGEAFLNVKYVLGLYNVVFGHSQILSRSKKIMNENGDLTTTISNSYDNNLQRAKSLIINGLTNDKRTVEYYYPDDFLNIDNSDWIKQLDDRNVKGLVVEQVTKNERDEVIAGNYSKYDEFEGMLLPAGQSTLRLNGSIDDLNYSVSQMGGSPDSRYSNNIEILSYDEVGNISEYRNRSGVVSCLIWEKDQVVFQAENSVLESVFYESFESPIYSGEYAYSGDYSFQGSTYVIPNERVPVGEHLILSYYYLTGDGWKYKQIDFNPANLTVEESEAQAYDEIRIAPESSMVTTYHSEDLVGLKDQLDPNNLGIRLRYDNLNRLQKVINTNKATKAREYQYFFKRSVNE
ncbi:hypothetical protein [Ekhidna sp.]|jgi:hypothetical protein|uniref:hypothetical protein n=1 Tax=Ekhidna sp. TaxID=2608089 RepID=UPI0032EC84C4